MKKPSDILTAAKAIISNPAEWTQGVVARDSTDEELADVFNEDACKFCSYGALIKAAGPDTYSAYYNRICATNQLEDRHVFVRCVAHLATAFGGNVGSFNDAHPHQAVMERWDIAIQAAVIREAEPND